MQTIDSGFCRTPSGANQAGATQGARGSHGSLQDRADQFVRATVLSDLGQSVGHGRHARGIQGVADAVAKALSGQDVTGTDAADDVLKKIETSLHKAAQAMADRGVDGKTIDATIDRFRAQLAGALDGMVKGATGSGSGTSGATPGSSTDAPANPPTPVPATSVTSVSKFVSREVRKERGAIDLVTAEGDRVSIRFRSKEVVAGSATQATSSDGTTTTAAKSSVFSRGGIKIEVDGDLNEDEQKAIGDLLGKVDDLATKFFSGDVQAAFSAAGSLGVDSDQIAAYRMNLTYSRKVAAVYGAWGASAPASTQPPATTGDGTTAVTDDSASGSGVAVAASSRTWSGLAVSASGRALNGSAASSGAASGTGAPSATADGDAGSTTDGTAGTDASSGATDGTAGTDAGSGATDGTTTTGSSDTPPATTQPASAQKTIIDFINDALSKLGSANGAGRLSFSTHWKMSVLVTAIESTQPAQPTTPSDQSTAANAQLLGDSLQKIASA
jgi:hypothetical protein